MVPNKLAILTLFLTFATGASGQDIGTPDPDRIAHPVLLDPHGDHRMAFCFALLGLLAPGVRVRSPGCVAKSWASFWEDVAELGAAVRRP